MKYKRIVVSGRVQGVGFREFLRKEVTSIGGIIGYAKNLNNGNLVIVIKGEDDKIKNVIDKCRRGPLLASVQNVSVEEVELEDEFDSFIIKM